MEVGDVVVLESNQTSGYKDGDIGIIVNIEQVSPKCEICWVLMRNDITVPFWPEELRTVDEKG
tara:strand:+ start:150 stop:338 length:189 start_codon:yes stop_codon:yes gene_type:complete